MVRPLLAFGLLALLALAGCSESGDDTGDGEPTTTTSGPQADPCPLVNDDTLVVGWTKHGGEWGTVPTAEGHVEVVCGKATGALDHLVWPGASFNTLVANVSFNMLQDEVGGGSGAGLVINYEDADNYVIVRYSIREQGWHLFTVIDGVREKRDEASVAPPTTNPDYHEWVPLGVRHEGGHVTAFDNSTKVIDYVLPSGASRSGAVGYFLRDEGMVALFDEFSATTA